MSGAVTDEVVRDRTVARRVTYSVLAVLVLAAITQVEIWPVTAYRLFSVVRTGTQTTLELVATDDAGVDHHVRVDTSNPVLVTTGRQYAALADRPEATQRQMVTAWLEASGVDPATIDHVRLVRATREMDPDTYRWHETGTELVVEVDL
jgi:hypothetical protein